MTSTAGPTESFQIPIEAAERYEAAFVPGFFAQWAPILCEVAGVAEGHDVLDVACGTGIVARTAADLVGPPGTARRSRSQRGDAHRRRPRSTRHRVAAGRRAEAAIRRRAFDTVLCQMALMFFADRPRALGEMARVVLARRHGGSRRPQRPRRPG